MANNYNTTPAQGEHIGEQLSAYIDGALNATEHEAARLHLQSCTLCRADHNDLMSTRTLLQSAPMLAPPRAFTLSEALVSASPRRIGFWDRLFAPRNAPRMALGSALSFALVLILLVGNLGLMQSLGLTTPASHSDTAFSTDAPPEEHAIAEGRSVGTASEETTKAQTKAADAPVVMAPAPTTAGEDNSVLGGSTSLGSATPETGASQPQSPITLGGALSPGQTPAPDNVLGYDNGAAATATAISAAGTMESEASGKAAASPPDARYENPANILLVTLLALFAALALALGVGAYAARRRA